MDISVPLFPSYHCVPKCFLLCSNLDPCSHVCICVDAHQSLLVPPYAQPFPVIECSDKTFSVEICGNAQCVSVDRLKPAVILIYNKGSLQY